MYHVPFVKFILPATIWRHRNSGHGDIDAYSGQITLMIVRLCLNTTLYFISSFEAICFDPIHGSDSIIQGLVFGV